MNTFRVQAAVSGYDGPQAATRVLEVDPELRQAPCRGEAEHGRGAGGEAAPLVPPPRRVVRGAGEVAAGARHGQHVQRVEVAEHADPDLLGQVPHARLHVQLHPALTAELLHWRSPSS